MEPSTVFFIVTPLEPTLDLTLDILTPRFSRLDVVLISESLEVGNVITPPLAPDTVGLSISADLNLVSIFSISPPFEFFMIEEYTKFLNVSISSSKASVTVLLFL